MNNGVSRPEGNENNYWEADLGENGAAVTLHFDHRAEVSEVQITFDTNLTKEILPSMTRNIRARQVKGMPLELVKDYRIQMFLDGQEVFDKTISDNYMRMNRIELDEKVECDSVVITVMQTYGIDKARIFEVRVY